MPIRKKVTAPDTANGRRPTDEDLLISSTYVPTGAYVVVAKDEEIDQQILIFAPSGVDTIGDRRIKVLAADLTVAEALRFIADRVEADLATYPKTNGRPSEPVKKSAIKRGGAGPVKTDDPDAPWGRLADGTPKQKPGRRPETPEPAIVKTAPGKKVAAAAKKVPVAPQKGAVKATKKAVAAKRATKTTASS